MRASLLLFTLVVASCGGAAAAPVTTSATLAFPSLSPPVLIEPGINVFPFVFVVPGAADITELQDLTLEFSVYDDSPTDRNENFRLVFQVPGPNLQLTMFDGNLGSSLGATDPTSAHTVRYSLSAAERAAVMPDIVTNGGFIIRLNRDEGDFYVSNATASLTMVVPEPATVAGTGAALLLVAAWRRRRKD